MLAVLVLTVGSYLFYIAKTTNVSDLQDALKATTVIYDKEGNQAGSLSVYRMLQLQAVPQVHSVSRGAVLQYLN